jgi:hypothetical protein
VFALGDLGRKIAKFFFFKRTGNGLPTGWTIVMRLKETDILLKFG